MPRKEKVTRVVDGGTLKNASRKHPVRLANVDAPEKGERGAAPATGRLRRMIEDQVVSIDTVARDRHGWAVANVKVGRRSVNAAMRKETGK